MPTNSSKHAPSWWTKSNDFAERGCTSPLLNMVYYAFIQAICIAALLFSFRSFADVKYRHKGIEFSSVFIAMAICIANNVLKHRYLEEKNRKYQSQTKFIHKLIDQINSARENAHDNKLTLTSDENKTKLGKTTSLIKQAIKETYRHTKEVWHEDSVKDEADNASSHQHPLTDEQVIAILNATDPKSQADVITAIEERVKKIRGEKSLRGMTTFVDTLFSDVAFSGFILIMFMLYGMIYELGPEAKNFSNTALAVGFAVGPLGGLKKLYESNREWRALFAEREERNQEVDNLIEKLKESNLTFFQSCSTRTTSQNLTSPTERLDNALTAWSKFKDLEQQKLPEEEARETNKRRRHGVWY